VGVDREKERGKVGFCFTAALRRDVEGGGEVLRSLAAGRRGGGRDADAAERGGGAVPWATAVGEVEPGEAGRVRGGAGEGAGAAEAQPASERGHQAGRHAAPVVGDHCFVGHWDGQDSVDDAVAGVMGVTQVAGRVDFRP